MIVVAAILEKGDIFVMDTTRYKVLHCDDEGIIVRRINKEGYSEGSRQITVGRKSKKKLILIEDCDWGDIKNFPNIFTQPSQ